MPRPSTPNEVVDPECEDHTPVKARIQGAKAFADSRRMVGVNNDIFRLNHVSKTTGYRHLKSNSRRIHNLPNHCETRGRWTKISKAHIRKMEDIIQNGGIQKRAFSWAKLGAEAGLTGKNAVNERTIRNTMGSMDYHKCLACQKGWVSPYYAQKRLQFAKEYRQKPMHFWKSVRFSDECHFGLGPTGKLRIIRRPGERYCMDCIQEVNEPKKKDEKRYHVWAMVGWDFKSDLIFYEVPGNSNGKMSHEVYIEKILEPVIKPLLLSGDRNWILEEDGDSGHGPGRNNIVRDWKDEWGLNYYFNAPKSPDLAIIENCWQPVKDELWKTEVWSDATLLDIIRRAWKEKVSQRFINERVIQMHERLDDVIEGKGKMTGH